MKMKKTRRMIAMVALLLVVGHGCNSSKDEKPPAVSAPVGGESESPRSSVENAPEEAAAPESSDAAVVSGCTMDSIRKTVQTRKAQITQCYTEAALKDPSVGGRIALQLGIGPSGKLLQRGVVESELPESVAACILKSLRGLQFPGAFEKPCGIVYPLVFSSSTQRGPKGNPRP